MHLGDFITVKIEMHRERQSFLSLDAFIMPGCDGGCCCDSDGAGAHLREEQSWWGDGTRGREPACSLPGACPSWDLIS